MPNDAFRLNEMLSSKAARAHTKPIERHEQMRGDMNA